MKWGITVKWDRLLELLVSNTVVCAFVQMRFLCFDASVRRRHCLTCHALWVEGIQAFWAGTLFLGFEITLAASILDSSFWVLHQASEQLVIPNEQHPNCIWPFLNSRLSNSPSRWLFFFLMHAWGKPSQGSLV